MTFKFLSRTLLLSTLLLIQQTMLPKPKCAGTHMASVLLFPTTSKLKKTMQKNTLHQTTTSFLSIIPIQDENLTADHLAEAVVEMAKELEYDVVDNADETTMQDFTGYYVVGQKDGVNAIVMAMMDTRAALTCSW